MKKWLSIAIIFILMGVMVAITGCITDDSTTVPGKVYNTTDYRAYVDYKNKNTGATGYFGVGANNSISKSLSVGTYDLVARYYTGDEYIDSTELTIEARDSSWSIIISNSSLSAYSI